MSKYIAIFVNENENIIYVCMYRPLSGEQCFCGSNVQQIGDLQASSTWITSLEDLYSSSNTVKVWQLNHEQTQLILQFK